MMIVCCFYLSLFRNTDVNCMHFFSKIHADSKYCGSIALEICSFVSETDQERKQTNPFMKYETGRI